MSSFLDSNTLGYCPYQQNLKKRILFVNKNNKRKINQLLTFIWKCIRLQFHHDLTFFVDYFYLIEQKIMTKRMCCILQLCLLYSTFYYASLWLLNSELSHFEHLILFDTFYLIDIDSSNNFWLLILCLFCIRYCSLLLTGNNGSTKWLLYRLLVQANSNDFVYPLVSSLEKNSHFKRYIKPSKRMLQKHHTDKNRKSATWAQYFQSLIVQVRNVLQLAHIFAGIFHIYFVVLFYYTEN